MDSSVRAIWEGRQDGQTDDDRLVERLTERPAARRARIARKAVDPETASALRRLWAA